jgi:hypothetical protein
MESEDDDMSRERPYKLKSPIEVSDAESGIYHIRGPQSPSGNNSAVDGDIFFLSDFFTEGALLGIDEADGSGGNICCHCGKPNCEGVGFISCHTLIFVIRQNLDLSHPDFRNSAKFRIY